MEKKKSQEELVLQNAETIEIFVNPFDTGVSYKDFQNALGKKTVQEYCKDKLTDSQIGWLENELSIINKK